jgi:hypothetical protein
MNGKSTFDGILNVLNDFKGDGENISGKRRNTRFRHANFFNEWIEYRLNDRECNAIEDCPCYIPFLNAGKLEKRQ